MRGSGKLAGGTGGRSRIARRGSSRRGRLRRWRVLGITLALAPTALGVAPAPGTAVAAVGARPVSEPLAPVHSTAASAGSGNDSSGSNRSGSNRSGNTRPGSIGSGNDTEAPARARWLWPLDPPPRVVRGFEAPPGPYAAGHRGVDLAAAPGQAVRAPAGGVVAFTGWVAGREVLSIDHAGGLRTTYEPVQATVTVGSEVRPGEVAGVVSGSPGHCLPGTCLHWGLRRGEDYLNPLRMVAAAGSVRLLPLRSDGATATAGLLPQLGAAPWLAIESASPDRGPLLAGGR